MARLLRPVTKIISVMPAAAASWTAYWMSGLSTIGIISFGLALVTGRNRLPNQATGNTAFLSLGITAPSETPSAAAHRSPERRGCGLFLAFSPHLRRPRRRRCCLHPDRPPVLAGVHVPCAPVQR